MIDPPTYADSVKISHVGTMPVLLSSFRSWRQLASFLDWIPHHELTGQLGPALRISCGHIRMGSPARLQAMQIMKQNAAEKPVTEKEANQDSRPEGESPGTFEDFLKNHFRGAYCHHCNQLPHSASRDP